MTAAAWFVTGGTGFLGRLVLPGLVREGPVLALTRRPDVAGNLEGVTWLQGDMDVPGPWLARLAEVPLGGILHMGAHVAHTRRDGDGAVRDQVEAVACLANLAKERGVRMVFISSSGTVGCSLRPDDAPDDDAPHVASIVGRWPYYRGKVEAERTALRLLADRPGHLVMLRPPMLMGPGDTLGRSTSTLRRYLSGRLPFLIRGGIHVADVRDVAQAVLAACRIDDPNAAYNLPGHAEALMPFLKRCERLCGVPAPTRHVPWPVAWVAAWASNWLADRTGRHPWLPDPVVIEMGRHHWGLVGSAAPVDLGYRPRPVDETLAETLAWLRQDMAPGDSSTARAHDLPTINRESA
ncbi:MAG: NAD-dependent epimerase/dehydratase family protein [Candidatus Sericytochromatia bacterium]|nr:NAD-dependent epimerase/dehydratase family protein [Candidatus Tanganyikabacteria bacterium]